MISRLKDHPFAVEAFFEKTVILTFAVRKEDLAGLVPGCLSLDIFDGKWAFIAVAMVRTTGLRPKGFPAILGNDFFLIGYRVFVRYTTHAGKRLRGLYILKSHTDSNRMTFFGNLFTHYNYTTTGIIQHTKGNITRISSLQGDFRVEVEDRVHDVPIPQHSPFAGWKEARKFAGPLPFTFTCKTKTNEVLIIQGKRQHWTPRPLRVLDYEFSYLSTLPLKEMLLANAFMVNNIPYYWTKGKSEQW